MRNEIFCHNSNYEDYMNKNFVYSMLGEIAGDTMSARNGEE